MNFLELTHPTLKRKALRELNQQIRRRAYADGAIPEQTAELLMAGLRDRGLDAMLPAVTVRIYVDQEALVAQQSEHQQRQQHMEQLRKFVRAQASGSLIRALFPSIPAAEVEQIRTQMRLSQPGPAVELDPGEYLRVHSIWKELHSTTVDVRERYLALHDAFPQHTLLTLFAALNQR
ncbi:hypothetical protein CEY09_11990 [Achromobacter marplatensis]|uniref:DUF2857 domain-containing protein n=2 Tax=Achromobacter TaxID=222 RepID=A0A2K8S058_9BURK|nr:MULTISPECIES: hypothetical protein [Achromobacter]SPT41744.1 Protein of uncharacterised function (DUF2857) [Achromobacter denitrificans]AUA56005.1 hypothetical protein CVS48_08130 [Achromobacter spanius]MDH0735431.1 hypothetical protein [Achromobacter spanius]NEV03655.1 hypothetical protein [Achromobacter xylosoxidans]OWT68625.1 hypothetical protein CEY09_11990 [Achromobacter marplatensis]